MGDQNARDISEGLKRPDANNKTDCSKTRRRIFHMSNLRPQRQIAVPVARPHSKIPKPVPSHPQLQQSSSRQIQPAEGFSSELPPTEHSKRPVQAPASTMFRALDHISLSDTLSRPREFLAQWFPRPALSATPRHGLPVTRILTPRGEDGWQ